MAKVMRVAKWLGALCLVVVLLISGLFIHGVGFGNFKRLVLGVGVTYDKKPPVIPEKLADNAVLIFSKTNGFREDDQIAAANNALQQIASQNGWGHFTTENAAVFNAAQLARFKTVVWNSVSGDVLTPEQQRAFRNWLEKGGGFVALHGAGGDPQYAWRWYVDTLIGAQFIGHTMDPQFQMANLVVEDRNHPATVALPQTWRRSDEWYSFASNPRAKGYHVLVTIDERSYNPSETLLPFTEPRDLRMGRDHPMVWSHCVGTGRALYSALGHRAESYDEPLHRALIAGAIRWSSGLEGPGCAPAVQTARP